MVNEAVRRLKAEIEAVPVGQEDPERLRALWWALDRLGNTSFGVQGSLEMPQGYSDVPPGKNKCNAFVCCVYVVGAGVSVNSENGMPRFGRWYWFTRYPPGANEWAQPQPLGGFIPACGMVPGAIVAFADEPMGHAALYVSSGLLVYAGSDGVKLGLLATNLLGRKGLAVHVYCPR
ncbi:MAG: hypothetical protein HRF45_02790 [Fimbriimonadia bacterium]|jgi:hypothetical protein